MRSKTTATLLSLMDIRVHRLHGGYRAFRKWVVETLDSLEFKPQAVVINGYTGTGKTKLLQRLERVGYPVLDLEQMAGHRGSVFGQVGLTPNNQKTFEAHLALRLLQLNNQPYVLMEAESKRIGKVNIPDFLMEAKAKGMQLFVDLPISERVAHILDDYQPHLHKMDCLHAFAQIKKRIHTPVAAEIEQHLQEDQFAEAIALLLTHYYDPRYEFAGLQYEQEKVVCAAENLEQAEKAVLQHLEDQLPSMKSAGS